MTGWRPPYAYVPGETARHSEDLFDRFGFDAGAIEASERWRLGLAFLREGFFWEAHEMFEPIWMALPKGSSDRILVQGLIQLANAGLKRRMGREKATTRLKEMAAELVEGGLSGERQTILELDREEVSGMWKSALGESFAD